MIPPIYNPDWPEDVQALYRHDMQEMWDPRISPHIWIMYHDELQRYLHAAGMAPKTVLDVGCAQGTLALRLAEEGHDVCAMDIRPQFLEYARSRYECGNIEFIAANSMDHTWDRRFDLIFANQILEHLVHPGRFVRKLASWLEPGGRLICTTPNARYVMSHLPTFTALGDPTDYESRQFTADGNGHFFAYTRGELLTVFTGAGLGRVRVYPYDTPWITGHMKMRFLQGAFPHVALRWLDRATLSLPGAAAWFGFQLWTEGRKT